LAFYAIGFSAIYFGQELPDFALGKPLVPPDSILEALL
jgi:hypothetical protein